MLISDQICLQLANEAYSAPPDITINDIAAIVRPVNGATVIAFRGTMLQNPADILRDLDAVTQPYPGLGFCHQGFLNGAKLAFPQVLAKVSEAPEIVLIGHSLGGDLAIFTTALLTQYGIKVSQCTTFGAARPSIGPDLGRVIAHVPGLRWVDSNDPVPDLPLFFDHDRKVTKIGWWDFNAIENHLLDRYSVALTAFLSANPSYATA